MRKPAGFGSNKSSLRDQKSSGLAATLAVVLGCNFARYMLGIGSKARKRR